MSDIIVHRGSQLVERADLDLIPLPESTDSYKPVSHYQLANSLATIGNDILKGHELVKEQYAVAREGKQFFGCLTFSKSGEDKGLSIGFRNSYDRSMAVGIAIGLRLFICDNLAFKGDITVLKKHTQNVWTALEDVAITTLYRATRVYGELVYDFELMRREKVDNNEAFRTLGYLFGHDILSPRQITVALNSWKTPEHDEFKERNKYALYNACTEALKSTSPLAMLDRHLELHQALTA